MSASRLRSRLTAELPLAGVLLLVALGFVAVRLHYWRRGLILLGVAVVVAAVLRLVLPARRAGLLVVRSRPLDVTVLGALGIAVVALAVLLPIV